MVTLAVWSQCSQVRTRFIFANTKQNTLANCMHISYSGVNVGLKASLAFMDQDSSGHFEKKVKIESLPDVGEQPQTIAEMFETVERIPDKVDGAVVYPYPGARVTGVPISFRLSPLPLLIPLDDDYEKYDLLEAELLKEIQDMVFSLRDHTHGNNYYQSLICDQDPRLATMFPAKDDGEGELNPWTDDVDKHQTKLFEKAEELSQQATETLELYKNRNATIVDLKNIVDSYNKSDLFPPKVKIAVFDHVAAGKEILNTLRPADATVAGQAELFIFRKNQWEEFLGDNIGFKLALTTEGDAVSGTFIKLYSLTAALVKDLGFKVRVAAPNIVPGLGFSLGLKINSFPVRYYTGEEIGKILEILKVIVEAKSRRYGNTSKFYSVLSTLFFQGSVERWNLDELYELISSFQVEFDKYRLTCTNTYLQLLEILTRETDADFTFVLTPQFITGMRDCVFYFKEMMGKVRSAKNTAINFRTIVAYFDTHGDAGEGPSLYILDKYGAVVAVAYDQLDFLLVTHYLTTGQGGALGESCLSPKMMGRSPLAPIKIDTGLDLYSILDVRELSLSLRECPFLLEENVALHQTFVEAAKVFKLAAFSTMREFVGFIGIKPAQFYHGKMVALLSNYNWSEQHGFGVGGEDPNWGGLKEDLLKFQLEVAPEEGEEEEVDPDAWKYLQAFIDAANYAAEQAQGFIRTLKTILEFYMEQFFGGLAREDSLKTALVESLNLMVEDEYNPNYLNQLLQSIRLLHLARFNENYFKLWSALDGLWILNNIENPAGVLGVLEIVAGFSLEEKEWVWSNPKFQIWSGLFLQSKTVVAKMYKLFCSEEDGVPLYFPSEHRRHLLAVGGLLKDPVQKWSQEWNSVKEMVNVFGTLLVKRTVPSDFIAVLGSNLKSRPELEDALAVGDVLFYWDREEKIFTCGWGISEISEAFNALRGKSETLKNVNRGDSLSNKTRLFEKPRFHLEEEESFLRVNRTWRRFTKSGLLRLMSHYNFHQVREPRQFYAPIIMLDPPAIENIGDAVLSYVWDQVKQGNSSVLLNEWNVFQYVDYPIIDQFYPELNSESLTIPVEQSYKSGWINWAHFHSNLPIGMIFSPSLSCFGGPVSHSRVPQGDDDDFYESERGDATKAFVLKRANLLTLLVTSASDPAVRFQLFHLLAQKSPDLHALPWIIPDITKEKGEEFFLDFSETLKLLEMREYYESPPHPLRQSRLLNPPYKLITALRVGPFAKSAFGKSTILNESMLSLCKFSSKFEPGFQNGDPIDTSGLVELSWLCKFTAGESFYENVLKAYFEEYQREMVLLANVHGDGMELHPDLIATLKRSSGAFLLFWGCGSWREMATLKPDVDQLLGNEVKIFNFVVDPDNTIRKNVDQSCIIDTTKGVDEWGPVVESMMTHVLDGMDATLREGYFTDQSPKPGERLVNFIENNTITSVRQSLKGQNHGRNFVLNSNEIRDEVLSLFLDVILIPDELERDLILWPVSHQIDNMSQLSGKSALLKLSNLTMDSFTKVSDSISASQLTAALRAARHELNLSTLSLTNLFRELNLHYANDPSSPEAVSYYAAVQSIFMSGYPLELINLSFTDTFDESVAACFAAVKDFKLMTISAIGPQGSRKSALLNKLFGPAFKEGSFGSGTNGVSMRLLRLDVTDKPEAFGDVDAILLLDTEGFSRTSNIYDGEAARLQRQVATLVVTMSDFCILTSGGDSETDWLSELRGILEISFFAECSLFESPSFPDMIIVDDMNTGRAMLDGVTPKVQEMLASVSNLVSLYPIEADMKYPMIQRMKQIYTRTFSDSLAHHIPSQEKNYSLHESIYNLRKKGFTSCGSVVAKKGENYDWLTHARQVLSSISTSSLFNYSSASALQSKLVLSRAISGLKRSFDTTFSGHEDLLEFYAGTGDNTVDFSTMNGIPYFCPNIGNPEESDNCECTTQLGQMTQLDSDLLLAAGGNALTAKLVLDELGTYVAQLRGDIVNRIRQEMYANELINGTEGGHLHTKLKELLYTNDYPWIEFKEFVSTLLTFGPWVGTIRAEILEEYGPEMGNLVGITEVKDSFEELIAFDLAHVGVWGQCPIDVSQRVDKLGGMLTWEEFIWLEVKVEEVIRTANYTGNGYKWGMLRVIREEIDAVLGVGFKSKLPSELEYVPSFVRNVHYLGVKSYLRFWEVEWERWVGQWDPLALLVEKRDKFPDELFIPKEE